MELVVAAEKEENEKEEKKDAAEKKAYSAASAARPGQWQSKQRGKLKTAGAVAVAVRSRTGLDTATK